MEILNKPSCYKSDCDCSGIIKVHDEWLCEQHFKKWNDHNLLQNKKRLLEILE